MSLPVEKSDPDTPPDLDDELAAYDYWLPPASIARAPAPQRDHARLLVYDRARREIRHRRFFELGACLRPGDRLVLNDTAVVPARLQATRASGGRVEVLLQPGASPGVAEAMLRPSARIREGEVLTLKNGVRLTVADHPGRESRRVQYDAALEELFATGETPLPPYLERAATATDRERYQTVYAEKPGAIAAPTAGLHFTRRLLADLKTAGIEQSWLTLHVGAGTFLPVRSLRLSQHSMHAESYHVSEQCRAEIDATRHAGGRIVAVGTTTARALESAADESGLPRTGHQVTRLMIRPPYEFRTTAALITNFHLPKSTLLALVSAFAGRRRILELYQQAVHKGYRFYSYGDTMLLL